MSSDGKPVCVVGHTSNARVSQTEARRVLSRVQGLSGHEALDALRFRAGTVCAPVARVVQQALAEAERSFGLDGDALVLRSSEVADGQAITRVRRLAHGMADWIVTQTTDIQIVLEARTVESERRDMR